VGNAAHVVDRSDWGKPKPPVEVLRWELCGKRYLARLGIIRGIEEKPHHQATRTLPPRFRDRGNPRHQRLATFDEREGQAAGRNGPSLTFTCHGWWKGHQSNQAARVVRVRNAEIGDTLFLGKYSPPDLERRESFVGTDRGHNLDPR
jgi:hypothetical protein